MNETDIVQAINEKANSIIDSVTIYNGLILIERKYYDTDSMDYVNPTVSATLATD